MSQMLKRRGPCMNWNHSVGHSSTWLTESYDKNQDEFEVLGILLKKTSSI